MSIYTHLNHKLTPEQYKLVVDEVTRWVDKQAEGFSKSRFLGKTPPEAYIQALNHLKHSLIDREERI
jgi:hypothetical protein